MIPDTMPIIHQLAGVDTKIAILGDVHIGSRECDLDGFSKYVNRILNTENMYALFVGDLIDNGLKNSKTNAYTALCPPSEQVDICTDILMDLALEGKILGMIEGNHEARTVREVDLHPLYTVACRCRCENLYRNEFAFIRVRMQNDTKTHAVYNLLAMHGATANKKKRFVYNVEGIDLFATGHTHQPVIERPSKLVFDGHGKVKMKDVLSITTCSWLNPAKGGYGVSKMYDQCSTSMPPIAVLEWKNSNDLGKSIRVEW